MPYKEKYTAAICDRCGNEFLITSRNYHRKINSGLEFRCPTCRAIENGERKIDQAKHRSETAKALIRAKKQRTWMNQSDERKKSISDAHKNYMLRGDVREANSRRSMHQWLDKTDDERIEWRRKIYDGWKVWNSNLSEDDRIFMSNRLKDIWNSKPEEYKLFHIDRMQAGWRTWWNSLGNEDKIYYQSLLKAGNARWWESMSPEERHEFSKQNWNNMSDERKNEIARNMRDIWSSRTYDEKLAWNIRFMESTSKSTKNKDSVNEIEFMNLLNIYKLHYERMHFNYNINARFQELFPSNPVTGGSFVSPFHMWDFMVYTNLGKVLIDIDGSIHDINKTNYTVTYQNGKSVRLCEYMQFNDSQRPYQTDDLDAYIVKCYDDKLTENTPVVKLRTNECLTVRSLLVILSYVP